MKKFLNPLALLVIIVLTAALSQAKAENQLQLINADYTVYGNKTDDYITAHAQVTNNSSQTLELSVALDVISLDSNHHYSLCAGGICGPGKIASSVGGNHIFLAPGAITDIGDYELKYHPYRYYEVDLENKKTDSTDGISTLRTTFTDVANPENVISFETTFVIGITGVYEILSGGATLGPNPSRGSVNFNIARPDAVGGELTVYDANGRPVKTIKIESASFSANMADLAGGAYYYAFKAGDKYYGGAFVIEK